MKMNSRIKQWLQPSLSKRLVGSLMGAFLLVWLVLVGYEFWGFEQENRAVLRSSVQQLAESLSEADASGARQIVRASERQFNRARHNMGMGDIGDLLFRVEQLDGTLVYASAPLLTLRPALSPAYIGSLKIDSKDYLGALEQTAHWRVYILEPKLSKTWLLSWFTRQLLIPLLIAFVLILPPLYLSVRRGLQPLRALVADISARGPNDLKPLALDLRYAELKPLEAGFNELLTKARNRVARESAFVQDAAHELRTPLAVITAQAHRLSHIGDAGERLALKAALERATERASHLVHQLLTLSKLEGPNISQAQACNVVELSRQILIAAMPTAQERQIELSLDSPEQLQVKLDAHAFHSILDNLLRNALAYCPIGARVEVCLKQQGSALQLQVSDDGPGIAAADRAEIFERFRRGRGVTAAGSGLGLAIVNQAAISMSASISLDAGIEGRGVSFRVCIPS